MYTFSSLKQKIAEAQEHLSKEYAGIRTGRAAPALLDGIAAEAYGSRMPLKQLASITAEDARTLRVAPFDMGQMKAIEKAISDANLGVSTGSDEKGVRVFFPDLTSERRAALLKLVGQKLEEARVSLRHARDDVWSDIQKKQKDSELSEDEKFRAKEEMEKLVKDGNSALEEMSARKEQELRS